MQSTIVPVYIYLVTQSFLLNTEAKYPQVFVFVRLTYCKETVEIVLVKRCGLALTLLFWPSELRSHCFNWLFIQVWIAFPITAMHYKGKGRILRYGNQSTEIWKWERSRPSMCIIGKGWPAFKQCESQVLGPHTSANTNTYRCFTWHADRSFVLVFQDDGDCLSYWWRKIPSVELWKHSHVWPLIMIAMFTALQDRRIRCDHDRWLSSHFVLLFPYLFQNFCFHTSAFPHFSISTLQHFHTLAFSTCIKIYLWPEQRLSLLNCHI